MALGEVLSFVESYQKQEPRSRNNIQKIEEGDDDDLKEVPVHIAFWTNRLAIPQLSRMYRRYIDKN